MRSNVRTSRQSHAFGRNFRATLQRLASFVTKNNILSNGSSSQA
jgi:hypothetical protein